MHVKVFSKNEGESPAPEEPPSPDGLQLSMETDQ